FGGAGPVHAAQVAEDLGMPRVLVPLNPGAFSALGLLCTDVRHDYMRSEMAAIAGLDPAHAERCFSTLQAEARQEVEAEGLSSGDIRFSRELDLRYEGQGYELRVSLDGLACPLDSAALASVAGRFHDLHTEIHGHAARDAIIEVVSYRLRASVPMPKAGSGSKAISGAAGEATAIGTRTLSLGPGRVLDAAIWRREQLSPGWTAQGPAIVEQHDATTIVPDGWTVRCDDHLNLVLERAAQ
ncbi:MAG: hypothetical protein KDJ29_13575, partial [Hyphomicrobiales bacterium]|nr:hypothetical protein [Hyphomicrobiales bacterium]